jgi:hypothetical protein
MVDRGYGTPTSWSSGAGTARKSEPKPSHREAKLDAGLTLVRRPTAHEAVTLRGASPI